MRKCMEIIEDFFFLCFNIQFSLPAAGRWSFSRVQDSVLHMWHFVNSSSNEDIVDISPIKNLPFPSFFWAEKKKS